MQEAASSIFDSWLANFEKKDGIEVEHEILFLGMLTHIAPPTRILPVSSCQGIVAKEVQASYPQRISTKTAPL